jgi:hypothetical protein
MVLCSGVCRSSSRGNTGLLRNDNAANKSPHDISMRPGAKVCDSVFASWARDRMCDASIFAHAVDTVH